MHRAVDLHENLVEVPPVVRVRTHPLDPSLTDLRSEKRAKLHSPKSDRFMADVDAALMQKIFDIAHRKRKSDIHRYRKADELAAGSEVAERVGLVHSKRVGVD